MGFYQPRTYPMSCTHIQGLPCTTFQASLQNVSMHIILYHLTPKKTYNHHALSTLSVESFFSDLSAMANSNTGIPLTANIPRYLAKVTQLNSIKHDPTKYVHLGSVKCAISNTNSLCILPSNVTVNYS